MFRDAELRGMLYSNIGVIVTLVALLCNLLDIKRKRLVMSGTSSLFVIKMKDVKSKFFIFKILSNITFVAFVEIFILFCVQYLFPILMNPTFGDLVNTGTNYFGLLTFAPIFSVVFCCLFWVNPLKQMDLAVIAFPLALSISKNACFCAGCCHGIEWINGTFNYKYGRPEVPVQLIESACAFLIFVFLLKYRKKAKAGTVYPIYLIVYSILRFATEFLRAEPNVLGPLKTYHILCITGFVIGLILYFVAIKFGDKITYLFENTTYFKKGELHEKVVAMREEIANTDFSKKSKKKVKETVTE